MRRSLPFDPRRCWATISAGRPAKQLRWNADERTGGLPTQSRPPRGLRGGSRIADSLRQPTAGKDTGHEQALSVRRHRREHRADRVRRRSIVTGFKGRDRVHSDLAREQIVGTPDSSIPNQLVNAGAPARGRHALRRGGGGEGEATLHTLWWPPSKVNGRYLAPWLAARDEEAVADHPPQSGGLAVQTDLHRDYIAS
jgi:hypothetical protein